MTTPARHTSLAAGRWQTLSLLEQMANIGSEVDRALRAAAQGRTERRDQALDRALELFDLAARDDRWRGPRRREMLRARESFCETVLGDDVRQTDRDSLSRYFLHFAVAARLGT
jgi:hypothetical protein